MKKKIIFSMLALISLAVFISSGCGDGSSSSKDNKDSTAKWGSAVWGEDKWNK